MAMRLALAVGAIVLGGAPCASGQAVAPAQAAEPVEWSFSAATYVYFVPDDSNYAQPTFTADRGRLHLEARYNYEDLETGSVWAGYNFSGGEKVAWEFTPMFGGVFGTNNPRGGRLSPGQVLARSVARGIGGEAARNLTKSLGGGASGRVAGQILRGTLGGVLRR